MSQTSLQYATDEDIAIRAPADFTLLCPHDQVLAESADGAFAVGNRWRLTSSSLDFTSQGIRPGHIVQLLAPGPLFGPNGDLLAVESSGGDSVLLRRKGCLANQGQPPVPVEGVGGIQFRVATLDPQINAAGLELDRLYGIDEFVTGRRSSDLYDLRVVRDAVVLSVLVRQYRSLSNATVSEQDTFALKADMLNAELEGLLARSVIHWRPTSAGVGITTSRFETRLSR